MASRLEALRSATPRAAVLCFPALAAAAAAGFFACQAFGGHAGGEATSTVAALTAAGMPWCLGTCVPDPGSGPVDCTVASGIDTLSVVTFDDANVCDALGQNCTYLAEDMYSYADGTALPFFIGPPAAASSNGYEFQTENSMFSFASTVSPPTLCIPGNHVLHVVGGLFPDLGSSDGGPEGDGGAASFHPEAFRAWGGGVGIPMQKLNDSDGQGDHQKAYCGPEDPNFRPDLCPPSTEEYAVRVAALDVSAFDGVSFWARRGPNSQAGLGVAVGDRYTDDDISYLTYRNDPTAPRHCERVRQCSCSNLKPCMFEDPGPPSSPAPGYYCWPPDNGIGFQSLNGQGSNVICGPLDGGAMGGVVDECDQPYAAYPNYAVDGGITTATGGMDPEFAGRPCTPYAWPNGYGAMYCFNPASDPPPAPSTQTCGDHWMKEVTLSTDWQFFKVPFTDLRQQGFAKKSEHLDLHSVSLIRFLWGAGWIDYWIDGVTFYHNTQ